MPSAGRRTRTSRGDRTGKSLPRTQVVIETYYKSSLGEEGVEVIGRVCDDGWTWGSKEFRLSSFLGP